MRLLNSFLAIAAIFLGSASAQAQILPRAVGQWEATAGVRALQRPVTDQTNQVVFFDTPTGATLLDSDTLTDLNIGLGTDISFSSQREDGLNYEIRFFFTTFERNTFNQGDSISSPFFNGVTLREVDGNYTSEMFSIELNQKRIFSPYLRLLHGIRFMNIDEQLTFNSRGQILLFPFSADSVTRARNPMLGYQIGGESTICLVPGVDVDTYFKCGVYNNFTSQETVQTNSLIPGSSVLGGSENELGFVSDFGIKFQFHIVENFMSFYGGYDGMYVNSFAAAPTNVNLDNAVVNDLDFWLHGITFGVSIQR
ncbi:MAG: hypothetical protein VX768_16730 [Planctomycetota bacterium]|nr:hypothetical protein [Planctomycetota bacterium]